MPTVPELKAEAKDLGIKGYYKMNKPELEKKIAAAKRSSSKPKLASSPTRTRRKVYGGIEVKGDHELQEGIKCITRHLAQQHRGLAKPPRTIGSQMYQYPVAFTNVKDANSFLKAAGKMFDLRNSSRSSWKTVKLYEEAEDSPLEEHLALWKGVLK